MLAEVHVATAGCDKKVAIWNVVTQRCIATRESGAAVVSDLAWQVCSLHLRRPGNDAGYKRSLSDGHANRCRSQPPFTFQQF